MTDGPDRLRVLGDDAELHVEHVLLGHPLELGDHVVERLDAMLRVIARAHLQQPHRTAGSDSDGDDVRMGQWRRWGRGDGGCVVCGVCCAWSRVRTETVPLAISSAPTTRM